MGSPDVDQFVGSTLSGKTGLFAGTRRRVDKRDWFVLKAAVNGEMLRVSREDYCAWKYLRKPNYGGIAKIHFRVFCGKRTEVRDMIRKQRHYAKRSSFN